MFSSVEEEPEGDLLDADEEEEFAVEGGPNLFGATESILYYKSHIKALGKRISILRNRLDYLRKLQVQFSLLTNKSVETYYGALATPPPVQKPTIPPLPPIHRDDHTDIVKFLSSGSPKDVVKFLNTSSVVPRLLFSRTSILDEQLVRHRLSLPVRATLARLLAWRPAPTSTCASARTPDSRSPNRASPRDRCSAA